MKHPVSKYSCAEIEAAGYKVSDIKQLGIPVDHRRKSCRSKNVEALKSHSKLQGLGHLKPASKFPKASSQPKTKITKPAPSKRQEEKQISASPSSQVVNEAPSSVKKKMEIAVKTVFEKQPVYGKKNELLTALEEYVSPIIELSAEKVFEKLKNDEIIQYSRSNPRGYSLS